MRSAFRSGGCEFLRRVEEVDLSQLRVAWSTDLGCVPVDNDIARIFEEGSGRSHHPSKAANAVTRIWRGRSCILGHTRCRFPGWADGCYRNTPELIGPNVTSNVEAALKMTAEEIGWASAENCDLSPLPASSTMSMFALSREFRAAVPAETLLQRNQR